MARYVAFLRAVNTGDGRNVKMDVLRRCFEALGFSAVASYRSSGNIIFESEIQDARRLEWMIEAGLLETLDYEAATFIRTQAELADIANFQPFRAAEIEAADEFDIIFLAGKVDDEQAQSLVALQTDVNKFYAHGSEIYWLRHKVSSRSGATFVTVPLETALTRPFTTRSAMTIRKLAAKYASTR